MKNLTKLTSMSLRVSAGQQSNSQVQAHMERCCRNRDRQVSLVVFIAAVIALSGLYSFGCFSVTPLTLPSMSPFH